MFTLPVILLILFFAFNATLIIFTIYYLFFGGNLKSAVTNTIPVSQINVSALDREHIDQEFRSIADQLHTDLTAKVSEYSRILQHLSENSVYELTGSLAELQHSLHDSYRAHFEKVFQEELSELKNALAEDRAQHHLLLKSSLERLQAESAQSISAYTQHYLDSMDASLTKVMNKVGKEILQRQLTVDDQRKLLEDALNKAKNDGFFTI